MLHYVNLDLDEMSVLAIPDMFNKEFLPFRRKPLVTLGTKLRQFISSFKKIFVSYVTIQHRAIYESIFTK